MKGETCHIITVPYYLLAPLLIIVGILTKQFDMIGGGAIVVAFLKMEKKLQTN